MTETNYDLSDHYACHDAASVCSFRDLLRSGTREYHRKSEALVFSKADPGTVEGYGRFLAAHMYTYQRFAGPLNTAAELAGLSLRSATILDALQRDLKQLDIQSPASITPSIEYEATIHHESEATAWGVGYVLEGACAGAAVLKTLVLRAQPDAPLNFINVLCSGRHERWSGFVASLDNLCLDHHLQMLSVRAARQVFAFLTHSINAQDTQ